MRRWVAVLTAVMVAVSVWGGMVAAQQTSPPGAATPGAKPSTPPGTSGTAPGTVPVPQPGAAADKVAQGKVKSVNEVSKQVTLDDGSSFTIPASVKVEWEKLKPGAAVSVHYQEQGAQKMVKRVEVGS
jgi:hypothetical protein